AGTPGRTVWSAQYRAFGDFQSVNTDPDGDGVGTDQPARFPGQFDEAFFQSGPAAVAIDGPYYNHHRWYDPSSGRYLQPETIFPLSGGRTSGQNGGGALLDAPRFALGGTGLALTTPTYAYANSNPVDYVDPDGRSPVLSGRSWLPVPTPVPLIA